MFYVHTCFYLTYFVVEVFSRELPEKTVPRAASVVTDVDVVLDDDVVVDVFITYFKLFLTTKLAV